MRKDVSAIPGIEGRMTTDAGAYRDSLKSAMRRMPGAVSLVTTIDPGSRLPAGLAASAVIPVSMDPPSMLVSINKTASACGPISRSGLFCINLLATDQTDLVAAFSSNARRGERFLSDNWSVQDSVPYLPDACAAIFCKVRHEVSYATHTLFIGEVYGVLGESDKSTPLGWIEGGFARLVSLGN